MSEDDVVALLRAAPSSTAIFTDFDGTLSPIVDDPAMAQPAPGAVEVLGALAGRYRTVAVISGRPVDYLRRHLPPAVTVAGLYGLEVDHDGVRHDHPEVDSWRAVVAAAAARAARGAPAGMLVEAKGVSLTLHYRNAPALAGEVVARADALAADSGLQVRPARMSVELHPPIATDKGTTLLGLAGEAAAACFLGDDRGDLAAFAALDDLAARGASAARIAVRSTEAPEELLARADLVLDGPAGAVDLLRRLR